MFIVAWSCPQLLPRFNFAFAELALERGRDCGDNEYNDEEVGCSYPNDESTWSCDSWFIRETDDYEGLRRKL